MPESETELIGGMSVQEIGRAYRVDEGLAVLRMHEPLWLKGHREAGGVLIAVLYAEGGVASDTDGLINASLFTERSLPPPLNAISYPMPSGTYFHVLMNALSWNHAMFNYNEWTQLVKIPFLILSGAVLWGILRVFVPIILNAIALLRRLSPI